MGNFKASRQTILVIDDEPLIRLGAVDTIEDLGFAAIEAENADAAVVILESRSDIAAVFTDIQMPGSMDGLKLASLIRERWPPIQILAASGNPSIVPDALPPGGRFLRKPYTPEQIGDALRELIGAT